jgi:sugar phosphate isomerase/epimerase
MRQRALKYGCQTFTWEMLGSDWAGSPDDLVRAISAGGYEGIEITDKMIGNYANRPLDFSARLADAGLTLVSFAYGSDGGFTEPSRFSSDLDSCRKWVDFASHFPGALVSMGSATVMSGGSRNDKFETAAEIYNRSAEIGRGVGVTVALHPSSHHNTLLFDKADYDLMFSLLDEGLGWVPDTGHILRGGQSLDETLADFAKRIRYVHLKDVDAAGNWTMLGEGVCDLALVLEAACRAPAFNGWVVVEEESEMARSDPAAAVSTNLRNLRALNYV